MNLVDDKHDGSQPKKRLDENRKKNVDLDGTEQT